MTEFSGIFPTDANAIEVESNLAPVITNYKCNPKTREAELFWRPPVENAEIMEHYTVEYMVNLAPYEWIVADEIIYGTSYKVQKLHPGVEYTFRVIAKYKDGKSSPPSEQKNKCNYLPDVPFANPTNVQSKTTESGSIFISWKPMSLLEHNAPGFGKTLKFIFKMKDLFVFEKIKFN